MCSSFVPKLCEVIMAPHRTAAGKPSVCSQASRMLLVVATLPPGEEGLATSKNQKYGAQDSNMELMHMSHSGWDHTT